MFATISGEGRLVTKLRQKGASIVLETSAGRNAWFFVITNKRMSVLQALLLPMTASPFDINHQDSVTGKTALHYACQYAEPIGTDGSLASREDILGELLQHKPDINIKDNKGKTPRDLAATNGFMDLVASLTPVKPTGIEAPKTATVVASTSNFTGS
jgi:hypothetical protein